MLVVFSSSLFLVAASVFQETNSVSVLVYGENNKFPGFFTPETESRAPFNTKKLSDIVDLASQNFFL